MEGLHCGEPTEEPSHRTPKILQNFGSQAQLFRTLQTNSSPKKVINLCLQSRVNIFETVPVSNFVDN